MKVLIVDDVAFICRILERMLVSYGFTIQIANSGEAALNVLRSDPSIDAVITDLHMPGMYGTDLFVEAGKIERLTDQGTAPPPAFILLTAERDEKYLRLATDLGFVQVFQKPPDEDRLIAQLKAIQQSCDNSQPATVKPAATARPPGIACPVPSEETLLSDDVVLAIDTLGEAIDTLVSFQDAESLRQLRERISPQLRHIERGIDTFQTPEQQPLSSVAGM